MRKRTVSSTSYGSVVTFFSESYFKVEHVFKTTAYLRSLKDDSLILISSHRWRSPFTVNIVEENAGEIVSPGEILSLEDGKIEGSTSTIDLTSSELYEQRIPPINGDGLSRERINMLSAQFRVLSTAWEGVLGSVVLNRICRNRDRIFSEETLRELVGAGGGFTPSGDDFLVGLLSSLTIAEEKLGIKIHLPIEDSYLFGRTSWASAQYIKYARMGLYDELVLENAVSIFRGDPETEDLFLLLARRGHESGLYIWLGLISGYSLIKYNEPVALKYVCG
ncbi:MAG: DUF2877 domain-containing protein [Fervidicoccaceae archaeon]|jgi:hypothetical protein